MSTQRYLHCRQIGQYTYFQLIIAQTQQNLWWQLIKCATLLTLYLVSCGRLNLLLTVAADLSLLTITSDVLRFSDYTLVQNR